ncbi:hypothetical protein C8R46DRAFT_1037663 [Mycena filopes]|nr:hypothetical protein C8R46DRAFT_1037663 [Mycena filopes]
MCFVSSTKWIVRELPVWSSAAEKTSVAVPFTQPRNDPSARLALSSTNRHVRHSLSLLALCAQVRQPRNSRFLVPGKSTEDLVPTAMSPQMDGTAPASPAGPPRRPRLTHIPIDALDDFLRSHAVEAPSEAVQDPAPLRRSPRHDKDQSPSLPSLPPNTVLVNPPNSPKRRAGRPRKSGDHRIAPQITVTARVGNGLSTRSAVVQPATAAQPEMPTTPKLEKKAAFLACKELAVAATSMDDLASAFRDLVSLMRDFRKNSPTVECFEALDAVQARLDAVHEFPIDAESPESFSAILSKTVVTPIQLVSTQLQAHHKALQSLTKSMEAAKSTRAATYANMTAAATHPPVPSPSPPKAVPITSTPDERILLRCDGDAPPIFGLPYHELVQRANACLASLDLPRITCASRAKDGGIFLVPESKECVKTLVASWPAWGPSVFPGARIIPPATYSHIQLDGNFSVGR